MRGAGSAHDRGRPRRRRQPVARRGAPGRGPRSSARRRAGRPGSIATAWNGPWATATCWSWPRITRRSARSRRSCPRTPRVGTVDKFQGQEAPVSIYSMTSQLARGRAARHGASSTRATASTSRPRGHDAWRWWLPSRRSFAFAPARRSRCGWRMRSASSPRWRPGNGRDRILHEVMPNLPSGTVTFVFSDIEGSTTLLKRLGDARYAERAWHPSAHRARDVRGA